MFEKFILGVIASYITGFMFWFMAVLAGLEPCEPTLINLLILGFSSIATFFIAILIFYLLKIEFDFVTKKDPSWVQYYALLKSKTTVFKNQYPDFSLQRSWLGKLKSIDPDKISEYNQAHPENKIKVKELFYEGLVYSKDRDTYVALYSIVSKNMDAALREFCF